MPSRRWWIVVVLTAFFSMHGVLLISPSAGDAALGAGTAQHAMAGRSTVATFADIADVFQPASDAAIAPAHAPMPDKDPGHGAGAHLGSLCLAVLAGVILLGALMLARRAAAAVAGPAAHLRRGIGRWPGLPRPPDLAALCLLRV